MIGRPPYSTAAACTRSDQFGVTSQFVGIVGIEWRLIPGRIAHEIPSDEKGLFNEWRATVIILDRRVFLTGL